MGIPRHSFCKEKTVTNLDAARADRAVAALAAIARDPKGADPRESDCHLNVHRQKGGDPVQAPAWRVLAVRAFPSTDMTLQSLCQSEGLTFWGEAIALVLAFCAANPDLAPLEGVMGSAPKLLFSTGGARRHVGPNSSSPSRGILAALDPETLAWIRTAAKSRNVSKERLAAAILHRHVRMSVAMIQAARRDV